MYLKMDSSLKEQMLLTYKTYFPMPNICFSFSPGSYKVYLSKSGVTCTMDMEAFLFYYFRIVRKIIKIFQNVLRLNKGPFASCWPLLPNLNNFFIVKLLFRYMCLNNFKK